MKHFFTPFALAASVVFVAAPLAGVADGPLAKKGDVIAGKLQQTLSSKTAHDGDTFAMPDQDTLFHHNAALHGATIDGHVENVTAAGPLHKASMNIYFDDVKMPDGSTIPLSAKVDSLSAPTHHIRDVMLIAGGAIAGHAAGNKMGKSHGGLVGAGAGFALASSLKSDIVVKSGTVVKLKLSAPLVAGAAASNE